MSGARLAALVATHLAAAGGGWLLAPREPVDTEVHHDGPFQVDRTKVLWTTVQSLREAGDLVVMQYTGSVAMRTDSRWLWLLRGHQELIVPALVSYQVPMSKLTLADVTYDDRAKMVRVRLPRLTLGEIAFQPEAATTVNGGLLTWSEAQVEAMRKLNYRGARRAMVAQAQQRGLVDAARAAAVKDVQGYFEIPLRIAGMPDVRVAATFD